MYFIGIDPSLAATAVCVLNELGELVELRTFVSKPITGVAARVLRCVGVADSIEAEICDPYVPGAVCIEGYSMGSNKGQHSAIIEMGYELRRRLCGLDCTPRVVEVPPSTLKKFCCGAGNADKVAVASALTKRYGVEFASSDEADAYGLARMALCIAGLAEPTNDAQRESVSVAMNGTVKKPKKPRKTKGGAQ